MPHQIRRSKMRFDALLQLPVVTPPQPEIPYGINTTRYVLSRAERGIEVSSHKHVFIALVLAMNLFASSVGAEESEELVAARLHDRRGQELFDAGDFAAALREMEAAQAVMPSTARLYNMAACNEQIGNRQAAIDLYRQFIASPDAPEGRRQRAERQLRQLEDETVGGSGGGTSTDSGDGGGDGGGDSGASSTGGDGQGDTSPDIGGGGATGEPWSEEQSQSGASSWQRLSPTVFYAMLGVTGAFGAALVATGVMALVRDDNFYNAQLQYEDSCSDDDRRELDLSRESGERYVVIANVMLGLTSAAALTTVILAVFTNWSGGGSASRLRLSSGPGLIGLSGSF